MVRRRDVLAGVGAAALGAAGFWTGRRMRPELKRAGWKPAAMRDGVPDRRMDASAYLSEDICRRELGVETLAAQSKCDVVAYNFPAWHPSPFMEARFGKGWTEYALVKKAKALFAGHLQPKQPLWGYFNEADPQWAAREIDLAADHGIGVWMIDWYWHSGTMFYHEQLEDGLLKAPNRNRLRFALMWANHDWRNVYPAAAPERTEMLLPQAHSHEDCLRAIDYGIEHYFRQPNYWRLDGVPVFGIFDLSFLARQLGGADGLQTTLKAMKERAAQAGLGGLHIQSNNVHGRFEGRFHELGIDSATYYHTFGWSYGGRAPGGLSPYADGAVNSIQQWKKLAARCRVPVFPDCPVGWDDSPRFGGSAHMVVQRTPDQFELLMQTARRFAGDKARGVVYLSSWNEWTEDHYLLPDSVYGMSYLEAVRRVFGPQGGQGF